MTQSERLEREDLDILLLAYAKEGNATLVAEALGSGARVGAVDSHGYDALCLALSQGHRHCARLLIPCADPDHRTRSGLTPLMIACDNGFVDCVAELLPLSDRLAVDQHGICALMHACAAQALDAAKLFLPFHAEEIASPEQGYTLLIQASYDGDERMLSFLLPFCDPRAKEQGGDSALLRAALGGNEAGGLFLLPHSDPLERDSEGNTALMLACDNHRAPLALIEALLPLSDLWAQNQAGQRAWDIARSRHPEIAGRIQAIAERQALGSALSVPRADAESSDRRL